MYIIFFNHEVEDVKSNFKLKFSLSHMGKCEKLKWLALT